MCRAVLLPVALQTLSMSLYRGLQSEVGFALHGWTATGPAFASRLVGLQVRGSGVDLYVGRDHFVVAKACSGMDSLRALLCLGLLVAGLARAFFVRRLVLLALVPPIILGANVIRVTLVLLLSRRLGTAVTAGAGHQALEAVLFASAAALLLLAGVILRGAPRLGAAVSP